MSLDQHPQPRQLKRIPLRSGRAALYVAGCASDLKQGVAMAQDAIVSGLAGAKIKDFAAFTQAQSDG